MFVSALTQLVFYLSIQHERNSISMCLEWIFSKIGWFSMVQNRFFKHQKLLNFGHVLWLIKKSVRQKLFINIVSLMSHSHTTEIWRVLYSKCPTPQARPIKISFIKRCSIHQWSNLYEKNMTSRYEIMIVNRYSTMYVVSVNFYFWHIKAFYTFL